MTLILAAMGRQSIWLSADRRLTFETGRVRDDARKVLFLETSDGVGILGYCGLGSTGSGTEPSDWMSRVVRGHDLPLEACLGLIADAARAELPRRMETLPRKMPRDHRVLVTAFVAGEERTYGIGFRQGTAAGQYEYYFTRFTKSTPTAPRPLCPRFYLGGSGERHLSSRRDWQRPLLRMIKAADDGRIRYEVAAREFAKLNSQVAGTDPWVGPACIVCWRLRDGGGGHELFRGPDREVMPMSNAVWVPTISRGMDVSAFLRTMLPHMSKQLDAPAGGETDPADDAALNADLAKLPEGPDTRLR